MWSLDGSQSELFAQLFNKVFRYVKVGSELFGGQKAIFQEFENGLLLAFQNAFLLSLLFAFFEQIIIFFFDVFGNGVHNLLDKG